MPFCAVGKPHLRIPRCPQGWTQGLGQCQEGVLGFEDAEGTISSVGLCGSGGQCCGCLGTLVGFWGEGRDGRVEMLLWGF